jgi:hypothetical protein
MARYVDEQTMPKGINVSTGGKGGTIRKLSSALVYFAR